MPRRGPWHSVMRSAAGPMASCDVLRTAAMRSAASRRKGRYGVAGARESAMGRYGPVVRAVRV